MVTEVHRYKVVTMLSEAGGKIRYDPHGPEVVIASAYDELHQKLAECRSSLVAARELSDAGLRHERLLIQQLNDVSHERDLLRAALGGMLFTFDDGVGTEWSAPILDHARTLCPAMDFNKVMEQKS